ncbi:hypothetical protein [Streptomyces sp. NPDC096351]|uniref:hypothetical protein n=1 Tax=Streptomyces sp. NPDC096351 TaxID=3366087 RepID=UPI00381B60E0
MSNTSHAHGQNPTNDPRPWAFLIIFAALCITTATDAAHISAALAGAAVAFQAGHRTQDER